MTDTLEAPPEATTEDRSIADLEAKLPASMVEGLNRRMAEQFGDATPETNETAQETLPDADASAEVEPSDAPAPEAEATPLTNAETAKPNESVSPPTPWRPDDVALAAAKSLGLSDGVVRDIRSEAEFNRILQVVAAQRSSQQPAPSPVPEPREPTALEKFLNDPTQDPDTVAAVKESMQRTAALEQQVQQIHQGTQAHQQYLAEQQAQEMERQFDASVDSLGFDLFGKDRATATPEQFAKRQELASAMGQLFQGGALKDLSIGSVKRAFAFAFPSEHEEQLRRQTISAARDQAAQRLAAGKSSAVPRTPPTDDPKSDPQVKEWLRKARAGTLTRDG